MTKLNTKNSSGSGTYCVANNKLKAFKNYQIYFS